LKPIVELEPFYLDLASVCATVALEESTVKRMIREKEFPKPRQLSKRRVGWLVREVKEWSEARPVSDLPPPPNTGRKKAIA
jgi:prophage regulatory protein